MSSYATLADLNVYGLPAATLSSIAHDAQQAALDAASTLADSYLRARYTLPLATWGADLRRAVCQIAAYDLMVLRGYSPDTTDANLRLRYEDTLRWLEGVRDNKNTPAAVTTAPDANPAAQVGEYVAPGAQGTYLTSAGWVAAPQSTSRPIRGW